MPFYGTFIGVISQPQSVYPGSYLPSIGSPRLCQARHFVDCGFGGTGRTRTDTPIFIDERISNPPQYQLCLLFRVAGAFYTCPAKCRLFYPTTLSHLYGFIHENSKYLMWAWRKMEDSNPQETIADLHVGFLDRCANHYTNLPYRPNGIAPGTRPGRASCFYGLQLSKKGAIYNPATLQSGWWIRQDSNLRRCFRWSACSPGRKRIHMARPREQAG